jgi:MoaA/NifB/PqqE/SkfB family radical SAM enzyme
MMRYDIEADWQLLNTCNYRCGYCFYSPETLGEKLTVYADPYEWKRAIDETGLTWLLHITGGEPTVYPRFAELSELLTSKHYISFNSNLTQPAIVDFAKRVDPSRVAFINAGLHAEEREQRKGLVVFLEHASTLREAGFPIFISIVCTPNVLTSFDEIIALTAPVGLAPLPKLLRGPYKGKVYPGAYTAKERLAFVAHAAKARASYEHARIIKSPTIDVFGDERYIDGTPWFRGRTCSAGERFVSLRPDGTVYRCELKESNRLGNLLDGSFQRRVGKPRCDSEYCFYFCLKYADKSQPSFAAFVRDTQLSRTIRRTAAWRTLRSMTSAR